MVMKGSYFVSLVLVSLLVSLIVDAGSATSPREPERDNEEYILDQVTNEYSRPWREVWDGGESELRFRLGSNNVRQWFIEEELKLTTYLLRRLRLKFYQSRLLRYTDHQYSFNTFEFEFRLQNDYYASLIAIPTAKKDDNSIGFSIQRRRAVNRYALVYIELPRFLNNFTEHHKATSDTLFDIYSRQPVRFGVEFRDNIGAHLAVRFSGYMSNNYEFALENSRTGERMGEGGGKVKAFAGWIEHIDDTTKTVDKQNVFGIEGAYAFIEKFRVPALSQAATEILPPLKHDQVSRKDLMSTGYALPFIEFGDDPFTLMKSDTLLSYSEEKMFFAPYLWMSVGERAVVALSVRFERRELYWTNNERIGSRIRNRYIVPAFRLFYELGARKKSEVGFAFISEYRKRTEVDCIGSGQIIDMDSERKDRRICILYEYRFRPDARLKIIESIDLDKRDWGQFSVHDHGFFQLIIGF